MHIVFFTSLFCVLSVLAQCIFLGAPEYLLSLDPARVIASAIVSAMLFLVADVVNERYGLRATIKIVIWGILFQGLTIFIAQRAGMRVEFSLAIFGLAGLFFGEMIDAVIYAGMRKMTGERYLLLRTFCGNTIALVIEGVTLLYAAPTLILIAPQFTWKFLASLLNLPIVYFFRKRLFN